MEIYIKLLGLLIMIEEYKSELIAGVASIASAAVGFLFARKKTNAEADNTLADGVAKIVETSNRLLEMTTKSLMEEKAHHKNCTERCDVLEKEVDELKKKIK